MVARMRTTSRASMASTPILTPILIRKSKKSAIHRSMHATDVLGLDAQSFAVRGAHPPVTHAMRNQSLYPTGSLLSVPGKKPIRPRARCSTSRSGLGSESSAHEKAADGSNRGVYLNARLNEPSASGRGTSSSLVSKSKWASATSGLSSEGKYLGSTDVSFYSAQEILEGDADSPAEPVISKDFIITPDHESADEPSTQAKSSPQGPDATDQSNSDEKLITSSANVSTDESFQCRGLSSSQITSPNSLSQPSVGLDAPRGGSTTSCGEPPSSANFSTDESFQCRGLSSSQITPNSLSQPSDQQSSQPSDEETHQPTDKGSPQSSDQDPPQPTQQELSERRDPKSLRMKTTESHCIIDCCDDIIQNKTCPKSPSDHHSSEKERPGGDPPLGVTRNRLANKSQDELVVGITNRSCSASINSSEVPDPVRAKIPASIDLKDNKSVYKCLFLRKVIKAFGPDLIILNERRKKLKIELQDKIRRKFQRGLKERAKAFPPE
ncbi:hypothetical protein MJO28_013161 [Puccinia striiformis f. sp. tritici]|uniref:Uncharacterized protein n=1 Tax=Puccinia striiformis f. sp. tritici TaxID=168172 RepID=A0ACC0DXZ1_9BASI|nr:hypothetical protein MJO28_013161 [Puccinia striiformis f. sp. tritici]